MAASGRHLDGDMGLRRAAEPANGASLVTRFHFAGSGAVTSGAYIYMLLYEVNIYKYINI